MADSNEQNSSSDNSSNKDDTHRNWFCRLLGSIYNSFGWELTSVIMFIFGFLVLIPFSISKPIAGFSSFWFAISFCWIFALAALLSGGVLGFLFGIPRTRAVDGDNQVLREIITEEGRRRKEAAEVTQARVRQATEAVESNTNLEQISDWVTKIIVGLGLVHIDDIKNNLTQLGDTFSKTLLNGNTDISIIGIAIFLFFSLNGFLFTYLWTRIIMHKLLIQQISEVDASLNISSTSTQSHDTD